MNGDGGHDCGHGAIVHADGGGAGIDAPLQVGGRELKELKINGAPVSEQSHEVVVTERRKLSISAPSADKTANRTRGWNVSPARAATLKDRARAQRRDPTEAQAALWGRLADKRLGFTFNREVVMGSAIVDFACKPRWLVVEIGGTEGTEATIAELSDRKLTEVGVRVLRFSEEQVLKDIETVVAAIAEELNKPFERPRINRN